MPFGLGFARPTVVFRGDYLTMELDMGLPGIREGGLKDAGYCDRLDLYGG